MGEGGEVDVYLDISRAFHTASHNIINDLAVGTEWRPSKTADNTKLGGVVDTTGCRAAIQRDLTWTGWRNGGQESHEVQ